MRFIVLAFLFGFVAIVEVSADNVDTVIKGFIGALDKMDIPDDRKSNYKKGLQNSRDCLGPIVNGAPPERIAEYSSKLGPIVGQCSNKIKEIPVDHVAERQVTFATCMKEQVESGFEAKQIEALSKIKECFIGSLQQ